MMYVYKIKARVLNKRELQLATAECGHGKKINSRRSLEETRKSTVIPYRECVLR